MQVQNFGTVAANDTRKVPASLEAAVSCARVNFELHIRQLEKPAHLFAGLTEKAKSVRPATVAELRRKLAGECFRAADATRLNPKY